MLGRCQFILNFAWKARLSSLAVVARVIYFTHMDAGELCMLLVYPKAAKDDIPGHILKEVRKEIEDDRS